MRFSFTVGGQLARGIAAGRRAEIFYQDPDGDFARKKKPPLALMDDRWNLEPRRQVLPAFGGLPPWRVSGAEMATGGLFPLFPRFGFWGPPGARVARDPVSFVPKKLWAAKGH